LSDRSAQRQTEPATARPTAPLRRAASPVCYVVDEDASIRHFLSLILHGAGIDTEEFADGKAMAQALSRRDPQLVFLGIGLESTTAIETILLLAKRGYFGFVQLMSSRGAAVLEHVKSVGV
jgi:DNA-binding response OmpR family regulator